MFAFRTAVRAPDSICGRIVPLGCRGRGGGISRAPGYFPTTSSGLQRSHARQTHARRAGQSTGVHRDAPKPRSTAHAVGRCARRRFSTRLGTLSHYTPPRGPVNPDETQATPFGRVHEAHKAHPPDTTVRIMAFSTRTSLCACLLVPLEDVESRPPWPRTRAPPAEPAHLIWTVHGVSKGLFFVTADRYWHAFTIVLHCSASARLRPPSRSRQCQAFSRPIPIRALRPTNQRSPDASH